VNLPDTNVWLALALSKHTFHAAAREWLLRQSESTSVLFCRSTVQSFLRLLGTEALMRPYGLPPLTNAEAWGIYLGFRSDSRIGYVDEPKGIDELWKRLAVRKTASPKLWMDAYLAAFAVRGNYVCVTTDDAFKKFRNLNAVILSRK
jgi:toxin-antitoxin system PIN domain toxin